MQIADILVSDGEPFAGNVRCVQGTAVIDHKTLERIATPTRIRFDPPPLRRSEAVILVDRAARMARARLTATV